MVQLSTISKTYANHENINNLTGIRMGYNELDNLTCGLQKGEVSVIASRPGVGKTMLAMNITENIAIHGKQAVVIFSLDLTAEQLIMRMVSSVGRISMQKLRKGNLESEDWIRLANAINQIGEAPIYFESCAGFTASDLCEKARYLKQEHHISIIVLDYLQLVASNTLGRTREEEIADIFHSLRSLARELDVSIIVLSQLSRSVDRRQNKRPRMSDLHGSAVIEEDADIVLLIYREEAYASDSDKNDIAEVTIAKNRNGSVGKVLLSFYGEYCRFENCDSRSTQSRHCTNADSN
jgi:replicative DNA helicase